MEGRLNSRLLIAVLLLLTGFASAQAVSREHSFDSINNQQSFEALVPYGLEAGDAGSLLLSSEPITARYGLEKCFTVRTSGATITVSYDSACPVTGSALLKYRWTRGASEEFELVEKLTVVPKADLVLFTADSSLSRNPDLQPAVRVYFSSLAKRGITAKFIPVGSGQTQSAYAINWLTGAERQGIRRLLRTTNPIFLVGIDGSNPVPESSVNYVGAKHVFSRLPFESASDAAVFLLRAAKAKPLTARPVVAGFCGQADADAICKSKAAAFAKIASSTCPSNYCLENPDSAQLTASVKKATASVKLALVSAGDVAPENYYGAVIFRDSSKTGFEKNALESGATLVLTPATNGIDWTTTLSGNPVIAGFTGVDVATAFAFSPNPPAVSVALARKNVALFKTPGGVIRLGGESYSFDRSSKVFVRESLFKTSGDPTIGIDAKSLAQLRQMGYGDGN